MKNLILILALNPLFSFGQIPECFTADTAENFIFPVSDKMDENTLYRVPIVFTVIGDAEDHQIISREFIDRELELLNDDYRGRTPITTGFPATDMLVEFYFHDIRRVTTDGEDYTNANWRGMYDELPSFQPEKFCNVYYTNISFAGGFSIFPVGSALNSAVDGNVVRIQSVLNHRHVIGHEIGHNLYLFHDHQPDSECGGTGNGDLCDDTAPLSGSGSGCNPLNVGCTGAKASTGNFMGYWACEEFFTPCQKTRVRNTLVNIRPGWINQEPPGNTPPTCEMVKPSKDTILQLGSTAEIQVHSKDNDGIQVVGLYNYENLVWPWYRQPYWIGWKPFEPVVALFSAKCIDTKDAFSFSDTVRVEFVEEVITREEIIEEWIQEGYLYLTTEQDTYRISTD